MTLIPVGTQENIELDESFIDLWRSRNMDFRHVEEQDFIRFEIWCDKGPPPILDQYARHIKERIN